MSMSSDIAWLRAPKPPATERSSPGKVTGKLKTAIQLMLEGVKRDDAAAKAGLTSHALYSALRKPHVRQHLASEMQVLRDAARPRAFHRMVQISEQDDNKAAAVAATKALLGVDDEQEQRRSAAPSPGLVIVIEPSRLHGADTVIDADGK
jgi:hypothetical protein